MTLCTILLDNSNKILVKITRALHPHSIQSYRKQAVHRTFSQVFLQKKSTSAVSKLCSTLITGVAASSLVARWAAELRVKRSILLRGNVSSQLHLISPGCPRPNSALIVQKSGLKPVHPSIHIDNITHEVSRLLTSTGNDSQARKNHRQQLRKHSQVSLMSHTSKLQELKASHFDYTYAADSERMNLCKSCWTENCLLLHPYQYPQEPQCIVV